MSELLNRGTCDTRLRTLKIILKIFVVINEMRATENELFHFSIENK